MDNSRSDIGDKTCLEMVRAGDKDRFLAMLFAPERVQIHLSALYAFHVEIARIHLLVSEPQIGEIRMQWWSDTLDAMSSGQLQDHPVAKALAETVEAKGLPVAPLQSMIEAHRFDLYADRMASLNDLEGYLGETESALFQLACLILAPDMAGQSAEASGFAGVAFGLARGLCDPRLSEKLTPLSSTREDLLQRAERRLTDARVALAGLPKALNPAFLPLAVSDLYLAAARNNRYVVPQWKRQWRIWHAARTGRI